MINFDAWAAIMGLVVGILAGLQLGVILGINLDPVSRIEGTFRRFVVALMVLSFAAGGIIGWNGGAWAQLLEFRRFHP